MTSSIIVNTTTIRGLGGQTAASTDAFPKQATDGTTNYATGAAIAAMVYTQTASSVATSALAVKPGTAPVSGGTAASAMFMSSTSGFGIYFGSGIPTVSAGKGSLYLRTDGTTTNDRMYVNTNGTTGWTAVTTAS